MKSRKHIAIASAYAVCMLLLLLFRWEGLNPAAYDVRVLNRVNLVPFHTIRLFLHTLQPPYRERLVRAALINLLGNIALFLPLGFLPPLLWEKLRRLWKTLLLAAGIVIVVEILQALLMVGTCDVDDLILNLLGAAIGYGIYRITHKKTAM